MYGKKELFIGKADTGIGKTDTGIGKTDTVKLPQARGCPL